MADDTPGISLIVPDFFSAADTREALAITGEALGVEVRDSGLRKLLASGNALQPIHIALQFIGAIGMGALGNAAWAGIVAIYERLHARFPGRAVSLEIYAENAAGKKADYLLGDGCNEALHAIPDDLERGVPGTRVEYDVDEGWLTWEESTAKKRRIER